MIGWRGPGDAVAGLWWRKKLVSRYINRGVATMADWRLPTILALAAAAAGCGVNRWNTRLPSLHYESADTQRREATHQDPFPDDTIGPDVGIRPPGYETPRTDPLRTKNHYNSTILKQQSGAPVGPLTGPGAQYPDAVHVD